MGFLHRLALVGGMLLLLLGQAQAAATQKDDSKAAIALLEKALAYYHDHGDKAFAAFSRQGEFVDKDRYVFVVDTKGVMLASGGPSSALIGRDVSEVLGPDLQKAATASSRPNTVGRTGPTARSSVNTCTTSELASASWRWVTTCPGRRRNKPWRC